MNSEVVIQRALAGDAPEIAGLAGELLGEIMDATGTRAFNFNRQETAERLASYLAAEQYFVFVARSGPGGPVGFAALCESRALYAGGAFGTIQELFVRPEYRDRGIGMRLVSAAKVFGATHGWTRLEATTPPLPQFDRALAFYEREGFSVAGGRKLKTLL